ncbi:MAG: transglycosylase domain-containing protein [Flavobacteriales bacterium]
MAKRKARKKKKGKGGTFLKLLAVGSALVLIAFFTLMQTVRSGMFGELPSEEELGSIQHEQATLVLANDGTVIGKIFAEDRTNVRYEDLPKHLIDALVSTEDARFFTHQGVDGRSYIRVFFRTLLGRDRSGGGGSTISQQIIKNLYGRQRHGILTVPVNKMKEALVAQRLERVLSKNDVLVLYFNSVPFGENIFGIEAAAQRFFSRPTKRLTVEESAVLVGMLKANTTYNPRLHPKNAKGRRDQVLELMRTRGHLTQAAADSLKDLPIELRYAGNDAFDAYGYFNARIAQEARSILMDVSTKTGTTYDIKKDGLRISTTLDPRLQHAANAALHAHLAKMQPLLDRELRAAKARTAWEKGMGKGGPRWKANERMVREVYAHAGRRVDTLSYRDSLWHYHKLLNGAVLMMDPSNGAVRAWVGGNDHRLLPYDLVRARRPIASTIKPVIHAAAVERGMGPCTYLDNAKKTYADFDDWAPDNFDHDTTSGEVALWYALVKSMNRPTVDLYFRTGEDTIRSTFEALGLPTTDVERPAVALGATSISLEEIVPAYGAFAMRGDRVAPVLITRIADASGRTLYEAPRVNATHAVGPQTAATITAMLQRAVNEGTGASLRSRYGIKGPFAGKTGTSQEYSDAWFVAYTPGLVVGTWVGAFDPSVHFNGAQGTGGQLALPVVGAVLKEIEASPELRKHYVRSFDWLEDHDVEMDCDPRREGSGLERLLDNIFNSDKDYTQPENMPEKKDLNFFERLFKKKE